MVRYVKFIRCSPLAFKNLEKKDEDTLYFVYDEISNISKLYLGNKLITDEDNLELFINDIKEIMIDENLVNNSFLVYDSKSEKWINKTIDEVLQIFIAPTILSSGVAGLVPAPPQGQLNAFLRSDGLWIDLDLSNYVTEDELDQKVSESLNKLLLNSSW